MSSRARTQANRRNASRSTGPRTPAGKQRSSLNALKHGLLSPKISLLYEETPEELAHFHERLHTHLSPQNPLEELIVERIIGQAWRLRRVLRIERDVLVAGQVEAEDAEELRLGFAYSRDARVSSSLDSLSRYERGLEASLFRNLQQLAACRGSGETNPIALLSAKPAALLAANPVEPQPIPTVAGPEVVPLRRTG